MTSRTRRISIVATAASVALILGGVLAPAAAAPAAPSARPSLPQLSPAVAGTLQGTCADLAGFEYEATVITSATAVASGALTNRGEAIAAHCLVTGYMNERVSPVDGQTYRIGFEMRLPVEWSGRYLYQGNGGLDGSIRPATGAVGGGESGLQMGMAVISSDAGHSGPTPFFGLDPQARLDYGYQAAGTLTPMAKALVEAGYGRGPDRSYMTGGSNGGRHTMVGAARYADQYDGFLAVAPGFNLPQAAVAQIWEAQQLNTVTTTPGVLETALTPAERATIADAILASCDGSDGLVDGMVLASERCQKVFSLERAVPTCAADVRDGSCLTTAQKSVLTRIYAGARTSTGEAIYSSFPYDPGLTQSGWASWQFSAPLTRDAGAVGYVFTSPPDRRADPGYALTVDVDHIAASIYASDATYTESAMEFMTPPDVTRLDTMRERGGKLMVIHGASDGVFSPDDTVAWYEALNANYANKADQFARYFEVAGMGHVRGGPATDQYDALAALVDWVEQGDAPSRLTAWVDPANTEVPATWSADRSRPLCAYPATAKYHKGDPESADSFRCVADKPQSGR